MCVLLFCGKVVSVSVKFFWVLLKMLKLYVLSFVFKCIVFCCLGDLGVILIIGFLVMIFVGLGFVVFEFEGCVLLIVDSFDWGLLVFVLLLMFDVFILLVVLVVDIVVVIFFLYWVLLFFNDLLMVLKINLVIFDVWFCSVILFLDNGVDCIFCDGVFIFVVLLVMCFDIVFLVGGLLLFGVFEMVVVFNLFLFFLWWEVLDKSVIINYIINIKMVMIMSVFGYIGCWLILMVGGKLKFLFLLCLFSDFKVLFKIFICYLCCIYVVYL